MRSYPGRVTRNRLGPAAQLAVRSTGAAYDAAVEPEANGGEGAMRVAVIDIGTNSTRLLVADVSEDGR